MPLDPVLEENTRAWLVRAVEDLDVAEHDLKAEPPFVRAALFHCQQAAEKAFKGFLTWHDRPFEKTHDLRELGKRCAAADPALDPLVRRVVPLTRYAWKFRYPGEADEPALKEAQDSLALARDVLNAVLNRLPSEVQPPGNRPDAHA